MPKFFEGGLGEPFYDPTTVGGSQSCSCQRREVFAAKSFPQGFPFVISIDGRAASGKTTLAARLAGEFSVVHMDDFFLPPALRTETRLAEAGGNIHHERFAEEVLPYIKNPAPFSYRVFDCGLGDFAGINELSSSKIRVVEGSYSCHPVFGDYADLRIFCDISPAEQLARIESRNKKSAKVFADKWIPMEEKYFAAFEISARANVILRPPLGLQEFFDTIRDSLCSS